MTHNLFKPTSLAGLVSREVNDCTRQLPAWARSRPVLSAMTVVQHNQSESHSSESPLPDDEESRAFLNLARPAPIMSLGAIIPPAAAAAHHADTTSPRQFTTSLPCARRLRRAQGRLMKKCKKHSRCQHPRLSSCGSPAQHTPLREPPPNTLTTKKVVIKTQQQCKTVKRRPGAGALSLTAGCSDTFLSCLSCFSSAALDMSPCTWFLSSCGFIAGAAGALPCASNLACQIRPRAGGA